MTRTHLAILFAFVGTLCVSSLAWAGSYLDRAALLINEANHAGYVLRTHLGDKEFSRVVHDMSKARLDTASHMQVPKEIVLVHPHLLMVLENYERASDAAEHGDAQRFLIHLQKATEEERIMRSVIEQLGWALPKI
jgi:hypothetical protein